MPGVTISAGYGGGGSVVAPHVAKLLGPAQARIAQAARIENTDEATARRRLPEVDRARAHYVRRLYRADIDDPVLFHLHIDSTVLSLDACAALIVSAYRATGPDASK